MRKRAITLTLALLLCLSCALPASASGGSKFTDIPDNAWYAEAVNAMADGGVLYGKGDGKFDPDAPVTLAELSVIFCRLRGKEVTEKNGHWAGSAMKFTGLGCNDDRTAFPYAEDPAYRADALSHMSIYMFASGLFEQYYGITFDTSKIPDRKEYYDACMYFDVHNDPYYKKDGHYYQALYVDHAYLYGIIHGVDSNFTCDAFGTLTRAQLAQMCYNMGWTTAGCWRNI